MLLWRLHQRLDKLGLAERCLKLTHINVLQSRKQCLFIKEIWLPFYFGRFCGTRDNLHGKCTKWLCHGLDLRNQDRCSEVSLRSIASHQHLLSLLDSLQCSPFPVARLWDPVPSCIQFILFRFCSGEVYIEVNKIALATGVGSPLPAEYRPWSESTVSLCRSVFRPVALAHIFRKRTPYILLQTPWSFAWFTYGVCLKLVS